MQLTTEVGYEAPIDLMKKKRSETIVFIYMKPPAKDIVGAYIFLCSHKYTVQGWPTMGDPKQVDDPFDFD